MKQAAAIIGMGNIGFGYARYRKPFLTTHAQTYQNSTTIELVAVADPRSSVLADARRQFGCRIYRSSDALFAKERPSIVSICTPDDTHLPIIRQALRVSSVRGIWCEKPIGLDYGQAIRVVRDCQQQGVVLLVNFVRRYHAWYQYIKKNLHRLVGQVQTASFYYSGGLVTNGSHAIDLLVYLFGECEEVSAQSGPHGISGTLRFKDLIVTLSPVDMAAYRIFELDILGSRGRLDLINKPFGEYAYRYVIRERDKTLQQSLLLTQKGKMLPLRPIQYMEGALSDLLRCMKNGREPLSSGKSACYSLEILKALVYSAQSGKMCPLPFRGAPISLPKAQGDFKR